MSKLQVLITGSTGFIGKNFLKKYSQTYDLKPVDLRIEKPSEVSMAGVDTVLHFAALVHQMNGALEKHYFEINTTLTKQLALKAKQDQVQHFIFLSTAHVYGQYGNLKNHSERLTETTLCQPADAYGRSKLEAENFLRSLEDENFKVSIIRSPLVYGPDGKGNLNALKKLITLFPILPFSFPDNRRSLIFVENLIYFIHLIIEKRKSGLFLPQDEHPISIQNLVEYLALALHKKVILFRLPRFLFRLLCQIKPSIAQKLFGTLALASEKSNKRLDYTPLISTKEAFHLTFNQ